MEVRLRAALHRGRQMVKVPVSGIMRVDTVFEGKSKKVMLERSLDGKEKHTQIRLESN